MALGYPHPDHLLANLSSRQISEWIAYNAIEPIGEVRGDLQAGIIASTMANINRGKGTKPYTAQDFMPDFDKAEKEPQSVDEMKEILMAIAGKKEEK